MPESRDDKMITTQTQWCQKATKYRVLAGAFLATLPLGVPYYYSNIVLYANSYFRFTLDSNDISPEWMISCFVIFMAVGALCCNSVANRLGLLGTVILAGLELDLCVGLAYFTVQHSVWLTLLVPMGLGGVGAGIAFAVCQLYAIRWFSGSHEGLAVAVITAGFGLSAIIYNQVTTAFLNPQNLVPDFFEDNRTYFSQQEILDKFPSLFFVITVVSVILQVVGISFLKDPPALLKPTANVVNKATANVENKPTTDVESRTENHEEPFDPSTLESNNMKSKNGSQQSMSENGENSRSSGSSHIVCHNSQILSDQNAYEAKGYHSTRLSDSNRDSTKYFESETGTPANEMLLTPSTVLRNVDFHLMWFSVFAMTVGNLVMVNYYKLFGALWIEDDQFLAVTGSTSVTTVAACRVAIGACCDRWGMKNTLSLSLALNCLLLAFWYVSAGGHRVVYLVWTNAVMGTHGTVFSFVPLLVAKRFRSDYFLPGLAILNTPFIAGCLMAPLVFDPLISRAGWFWLFLVVSALEGIGSALDFWFLSP